MPDVGSLPRTATRAQQLIAASARTTLDPFVEVDWDVPIDDSAFHLPPECLPLFETTVWECMSEAERIAYSRHEAAAFYGALVAFENVLMRAVLSHLAQLPVTHPAHRYLLVEVADECRHSMMFGEFVRRAGTPPYRPDLDTIGAIDAMPGGRATAYLLILAVEELFDAVNRLTVHDSRVHPLARDIARVHVSEEARHVSFAKTYLAETWPNLPSEEREAVAAFAPKAVALVASLLVVPEVYRSLAIGDGESLVADNPHHHARIDESLRKLATFLAEVGVISDANRTEWKGLGLAS